MKVPEQWGDVGEKCSKTIASDAFFTEDVRLDRPHTLINKISKIFNLDDICKLGWQCAVDHNLDTNSLLSV